MTDWLLHEKPRNALLILAEIHDYAVKSVVACELNGFVSTSIRVIKENTGWIRSHKRGYTHCCILVQCVGLPENSFIMHAMVLFPISSTKSTKKHFIQW